MYSFSNIGKFGLRHIKPMVFFAPLPDNSLLRAQIVKLRHLFFRVRLGRLYSSLLAAASLLLLPVICLSGRSVGRYIEPGIFSI